MSLLFSLSGHYTGHFKAVVYKPQNVMVMRDIMSNGYRAGGNTKFFGDAARAERAKNAYERTTGPPAAKKTASDAQLDDVKAGEIGNAMMRRLNFEEGDGSIDEQPESLLAFPMSSGQYNSGAMNTEMSVTSRLLPWEVNDRKHDSFPGGQLMQEIYEVALNLKAVHFGEDLRATEHMEYMSQVACVANWTTHLHTPKCMDSNALPSLVSSAGLHQQLSLLRRPAPQVG